MELNTSPQMPPVFGAPVAPATPPAGTVPTRPSGSANSSLLKTIIIILLVLLLIGALLLSYYFYNEYAVEKATVDEQVASAVLENTQEVTNRLEADFAEREKDPRRKFLGPADYGSLYFEYPQTWSAYIHHDPTTSSDNVYEAYLAPGSVPPTGSSTSRYALRITIKTDSLENALDNFSRQDSENRPTSTIIKLNGEDATRFDGAFSKDIVGSAVLFRIRDKVVTLQCDAEIYREDFDRILSTIKYNL